MWCLQDAQYQHHAGPAARATRGCHGCLVAARYPSSAFRPCVSRGGRRTKGLQSGTIGMPGFEVPTRGSQRSVPSAWVLPRVFFRVSSGSRSKLQGPEGSSKSAIRWLRQEARWFMSATSQQSQTSRAGERGPRDFCDAGCWRYGLLRRACHFVMGTQRRTRSSPALCARVFLAPAARELDEVGCVARVEEPGMRVWSSNSHLRNDDVPRSR
jgi:hypothetical protein